MRLGDVASVDERRRMIEELEDRQSHTETERTLRTVIDWARYAELFNYDDRHRRFLSIRKKR